MTGRLLAVLAAGIMLASSAVSGQDWILVPPTSFGAATDAVSELHVDGSGDLWVGTWEGEVAVLRGGQWEVLLGSSTRPNLLRQTVVIETRGDDEVWIVRRDADIYRFDGAAWHRFEGGATRAISKRAGSSALSGLDCVLDRGDGLVAVDTLVSNGIPFVNGYPVDVLLADDGAVWIAIREGPKNILRFQDDEITCWDEESVVEGGDLEPQWLEEPAAGGIWLAGEIPGPAWRTIVSFEDDAWLEDAMPISPGPHYITTDDQGDAWIAQGLGIWKDRGQGWEQVAEIPYGAVRFTTDPTGGAWVVGSYRLFRVSGARVEEIPYPHDEILQSPDGQFAVDGKGRIWFGDRQGLFLLAESTSIPATSWGTVKKEVAP